MTAVTKTTEESLQICVRGLRAITEHGTRDNGTRETLTHGDFRLLRRLRERAVSFYTGGR